MKLRNTLHIGGVICIIICLFSCNGKPGNRPIPDCQTATVCLDLIKKNHAKCKSTFTDQAFYLKNNHPKKEIIYSIEYYEQEMEGGSENGPKRFIKSDLGVIKANGEILIDCEFSKNTGTIGFWVKNIILLRKACFKDDLSKCDVTNPSKSPDPRPNKECVDECNDSLSNFCIRTDVCGPHYEWLSKELFALYNRFKTANYKKDYFNMSDFAPMLIGGYCGDRYVDIDFNNILIQGTNCTIKFPINHPTISNIWLKQLSLMGGKVILNGDKVELSFNTSGERPIMAYEIRIGGGVVVQEEEVERITITQNKFMLQGTISKCITFNYCGD